MAVWGMVVMGVMALGAIGVRGDAPSLRGADVMTNHWHVQLNGDHGKEAAKLVATRNGFSYVAPVSIIIGLLE